LGAILLLAGCLRLGWPGVTEFKQDEAHLYGLALDMAEFKALPLRGISSSIGVPNPPLNVYLFALPLFVWRSPIAATLFVGGLNTASVALAYGLARRYWGVTAALAAALLYAVAPWAVIYSRKIWAQDLLPVFVLGAMAAALLAMVEGRRRWLIAHLVLLAVAVQVHFSAVALVPVSLILLSVYRRNVDRRVLLAGLGAALLTAAPILIYALSRANDWKGYLEAAASRPAVATPGALELALMVVQGSEVRGLTGVEAFRAFDATIPAFLAWLAPLVGVLVAGGLAVALWRGWQARGRGLSAPEQAGVVAALWLVMPVLVFLPRLLPVYPHYFILLFPAPYFLAGMAVDALRRRAPPLAAWALVAVIVTGQVWLSLALLRFVATTNTPGAFGTPLRHMLQAVATARRAGQSEVLVVGHGDDPGTDQDAAVFDVLLRGTPHRLIDGTTTAVLPAEGAAVILWPAPGGYPWPVEALYAEWAGGAWTARLPLRAGEGEALIAVGGAQPAVPRPREASALLANGAEVLGTGAGGPGWQLWWRAPGPVEGEGAHLFAHLLDASGARIAQVDAPTYDPAAWRAGDLVVSFFALPPGGVTVRAGMYAYPSLAPVPVLDAAGEPAGDFLLFPR
jgi:4-amino-4-deoxy-L-arabinose transferase-like glycosyltransferase